MIETTEGLAEVCRAARGAGRVGLDTEFVWERTYYPTLGVVQVGLPDGRCELIDAPAIRDWSPMAALVSDERVVKILHDAQQDLVILRRACGALPRAVFDTQRAAGFVGIASTVSLSELLQTLLRVKLAKTETRSDWLKRPLTEQQVKYAEDDVRHACELRDRLLERARERGREAWMEEEMRRYEDPALYEERDPEREVPRVRGSGSLSSQQRSVLRALGAWRELRARARNLPKHFILSDEGLISLTRAMPDSPDAIRPMKGLNEKTLKRLRGEIWQQIERGRAGDLPPLPEARRRGPEPDEGHEARVDLALAFLKGRGVASGIDPALAANRADIAALVSEGDHARSDEHLLLRGWRAEFCGEPLRALLRGESAVRVDPASGLPGEVARG